MEGPRINEPKYKGVRKRKWGKWVSEVRLPNSRERIWLGSFDAPEKAAKAFDAAQFCLRGRNANFNFPDDPPDILGGQMLTPAEIQVVAAQYGHDYVYPTQEVLPPNTHVMEMDEEDTSPSWANDNDVIQMDTTNMDWSFLDMLDHYPHASSGPGGPQPPSSPPPVPTTTAGSSSFDVGFYNPGLDTLSSNLYSPPHLPSIITDSNDDNGNEHDFSHQYSFLWNF